MRRLLLSVALALLAASCSSHHVTAPAAAPETS